MSNISSFIYFLYAGDHKGKAMFKIGRTTQSNEIHNIKRFERYKEDMDILGMWRVSNKHCNDIETDIVSIFRKKCTLVQGQEWFTGSMFLMQSIINNIVMAYQKKFEIVLCDDGKFNVDKELLLFHELHNELATYFKTICTESLINNDFTIDISKVSFWTKTSILWLLEMIKTNFENEVYYIEDKGTLFLTPQCVFILCEEMGTDKSRFVFKFLDEILKGDHVLENELEDFEWGKNNLSITSQTIPSTSFPTLSILLSNVIHTLAYKCPRCGYSTYKKSNIRNHFRRTTFCPAKHNLILTDEIKNAVMRDHIYHPEVKPNSEKPKVLQIIINHPTESND